MVPECNSWLHRVCTGRRRSKCTRQAKNGGTVDGGNSGTRKDQITALGVPIYRYLQAVQ